MIIDEPLQHEKLIFFYLKVNIFERNLILIFYVVLLRNEYAPDPEMQKLYSMQIFGMHYVS